MLCSRFERQYPGYQRCNVHLTRGGGLNCLLQIQSLISINSVYFNSFSRIGLGSTSALFVQAGQDKPSPVSTV